MMIKYDVLFKCDVFEPKNRITTNKDFHCSIILYESMYPNETHLSDIALEHAWCKINHYFWDSKLIPLSVRVEYVREVEKNA